MRVDLKRRPDRLAALNDRRIQIIVQAPGETADEAIARAGAMNADGILLIETGVPRSEETTDAC